MVSSQRNDPESRCLKADFCALKFTWKFSSYLARQLEGRGGRGGSGEREGRAHSRPKYPGQQLYVFLSPALSQHGTKLDVDFLVESESAITQINAGVDHCDSGEGDAAVVWW
ncbi:hypothetical protein E2C01_013959 [Portunus trituberculatus]|uniref:Uncharacterized protein n=1 Tax=Portunus trituberculatus TaxID=210409 RepID=A0A5B7DIH2_PORTR|nr:hypothetical protein [Portunus trituberculatus]